MKEGFCQVASRPPKPESATPAVPVTVARWMGGSADQAAGTTRGAEPEPPAEAEPPTSAPAADLPAPPSAEAEAEAEPSPPADGVPESPPRPPRPPRSRSRKPMPQPSAPPLVTRDAIWSA